MKLINVPPTKEIVAESIRSVNSEHLNKFIILFGTVVRTGNVHNRELYKDFECKQCQKVFTCESDITEFNRFALPLRCDGKVETKVNAFFKIAKTLMKQMNHKGGDKSEKPKKDVNSDFQTSACKSKNFVPVEGTSEYADY